MTTLRERAARLLLGPELKELETLGAVATRLVAAYQEGPYELPPDELVRQLQEYDSSMVLDLVDQLQWQAIGSYGGYAEDERRRAVEDSKRMWKYAIIAQWIVSLWTFYGMGESVAITVDDEVTQEAWAEFWEADRNMPLLANDDLHEISWWLLVKGERFLAFYIAEIDGETTVRSIQPEEITELVTTPGDATDVLYYKREWTEASGARHCVYYPDWQAFFDGRLERAELPMDARRAELEQEGTAVCVLFVPFRQLDEDSLRGWPLLAPAGTPWIRGQREFYENRLAVSRAKAAFVRRRTVKGGSRAVDAVRSRLMSALVTGSSETNPVPVAGSEDIHNEAVRTEDLPMTTGAGDAKTDGEMFSWMAGLAGGVFPHYMGLGDAYRLATASAMERPIEMQFSLYRKRLSALFRRMVRIVIEARRRYGTLAAPDDYKITVSLDRMVEVDVAELTEALSRIWRDVIGQAQLAGGLPDQVLQNTLVFSLQQALGAMGATSAEELINATMWTGADGETNEDGVEAEGDEHLHESHAGEAVDATCPLCAWPRAVLYPDHGGLLVCEHCEKTFDPSVE